MIRATRWIGFALALALLRAPWPAFAQTAAPAHEKCSAQCPCAEKKAPVKPKRKKTKPKPTPPPACCEDLKALVEAQRAAVEKLQAELEAERQRHETENETLRQEIAILQREMTEIRGEQAVLAEAAKAPAPTPTPEPVAETREGEAFPKRERPEDEISTDFPGSIKVPGTGAAFRLGGLVWASMVQTYDALGSDDRFLTYSIPIEGSPEAGKGPRLSFFANPSRLNLDFRSPLVEGRNIRAYIEGDFAGASNGFRLRHAYVQIHRWLFGQTWSTFSDPDADFEDTDFEGVNAENVQRQTQLRHTLKSSDRLRLNLAIEYPNASITDVDGTAVKSVNQVPDLVAAAVFTRSPDSHLQIAAVLRSIRGETSAAPNQVHKATGWGLSFSGVLPKIPWAPKDHFIFQVNGGEGIARFINDLNSAGGQDAAFDPSTTDMDLLPALGWYLAYEHRWKGDRGKKGYVRSSTTWGQVVVDNLSFQPGSAYHRTNRLSLNLLWNPAAGLDLGAEYIWGERVNKDGSRGSATQLQLRTRYFF